MADKSLNKSDKLGEVKTVLNEDSSTYYSDIYTPGETKEQLTIGNEVAIQSSYSGEFDTADGSLSITDRVYTMSVPNPDGEIFTLSIDGMVKTFKIGFFGNTPLAYSTLETELQDWLGTDYVLSYVSGTNYSLRRVDKQSITLSNPNRTKNINFSNWSSLSVLVITIDGTDYTVDGESSAGDAIDNLDLQLSASIYFTTTSGNDLVIARKDSANITYSSAPETRYTYHFSGKNGKAYKTNNNDYEYNDIFGSGGAGTPTVFDSRFIIDGVTYKYNLTTGNTADVETETVTYSESSTYTGNNRHTLGAAAGDVAYDTLPSTYEVSNYVLSEYDFANDTLDFDFRKDDYSQISYSVANNTNFINDDADGFQLWSVNYAGPFDGIAPIIITENNHTPVVTVTDYSVITITNTLTSNNFFIPVKIRFNKIVLSAVSSVGTSEGVYELRSQSCTSNPGAPVFVSDKIFQTNASNYGVITELKRGGFVISFTTNTSNKINYTCT